MPAKSTRSTESPTLGALRRVVRAAADPRIASSSAWFFKTGPGEYGEGDKFLGIRVGTQRKLAREYQSLPLESVDRLLQSPYHEERLLSLLILCRKFARGEAKQQREIYNLYLRRTRWINNWDLVDTSARDIVGGYLFDKSRRPLYRLARSRDLWRRRIAIIATAKFIPHDQFEDTLALATLLLTDREDLIHKATGWMLREVGIRDKNSLRAFLDQHAHVMPRTMLRYSIERLPSGERKSYLSIKRTIP